MEREHHQLVVTLWGCSTQAEPVTDPRNLSSATSSNLPKKGGKIKVRLTVTDNRLKETESSYMRQNLLIQLIEPSYIWCQIRRIITELVQESQPKGATDCRLGQPKIKKYIVTEGSACVEHPHDIKVIICFRMKWTCQCNLRIYN